MKKQAENMKKRILYIGMVVGLFVSCGDDAPSSGEGLADNEPSLSGTVEDADITVDAPLTYNPSEEFQRVIGFGGMETQWTGRTLDDGEIRLLFGKEEGQLGYNILRVRIAPEGESKWRELANGIIRARKLGATILATPWSPPAEMKTNNSVNGDGELKVECYGDYADYLIRFANYMEGLGAPVDVLSIQNEPDIKTTYETCNWTPEQIFNFVKGYAKRIKEETGCKVMVAESFSYKHQYTDPILNDAEACGAIDCIGGHIYGNNPLESYALAHEKGKGFWMTEYLLNDAWGNGDETLVSAEALRDENMEFVTGVNRCMEVGMQVYLWWYLRRFYSMIGDGTVGSELDEPTVRGYFLSHFARYAAGRVRIGVNLPEGMPEEVTATAYKNADGGVSLMLVNPAGESVSVKVAMPEDKTEAVQITTVSGTAITDIPKKMEKTAVRPAEGIRLEPYSLTTLLVE